MKNILAIEVKDNKTIATLTKFIDGKHNLLLHKVYGSKPLANNIQYDSTIVEKIKTDLLRNNLWDSIDETYLTINTQYVFVINKSIQVSYNTNVEDEKTRISAALQRKYPDLEIVDIYTTDESNSLTKKTINLTIELVGRDYLREVKHEYNYKNFKINKIVSVTKAIDNSTREDHIKNGATLNVLLEEKFTQLTTSLDGKLTSSVKWKFGLTDIYQHISDKMNIDKNSAKKLFNSFGSIPPEDVVDNKVIHTRKHGKEIEIFTKKDLSRFITEKVNEIFANIKTQIDQIKIENNIRIVFNGEVTSLTGFTKYASKAFAEPNIKRFNTRIIGLSEETEFITIGILGESRNNIEQEQNEVEIERLLTPKINILKKITRMYSYI